LPRPSRPTCPRARLTSWQLAGALGLDALDGAISEPAWKTKPSWYLVATDDKMIPPPAQQSCPSARFDGRRGQGQPCGYVSKPKKWLRSSANRGRQDGELS